MITILQKGYMDYSVAMLNSTRIYNLEIKVLYKEICENFCLLGQWDLNPSMMVVESYIIVAIID